MSRGAQLHHFPTKDALLTAAVAHLLERRTAEFRKAFADAEPGADRLDTAIDLMWSMYQGPTFVAWAELWMAARTDAGLRDSMVEVNRRFIEECHANFVEVLPPVPGVEHDFYDLALAFATSIMDGLAFFRLVAPDSGVPAPQIIDALKAVAQLTAPTEQSMPNEEEP
ncbi:MAG: TetR/AcrR family transcriptional regulator [Acidimicrobiales bacterium]